MTRRSTFRAAVLYAPGAPLLVESVHRATPLSDFDVLVEIEACGICHSDLEVADGAQPYPMPLVLGHEVAGKVAEVGAQVTRVSPGDRVVLSWSPRCGACFYCRHDQPILCEVWVRHMRLGLAFDGTRPLALPDGRPLHPFLFLGGFAEFCVVTEQCTVPIPLDVPADVACLIGCAVATGFCAVRNLGRPHAGESVAVLGCGAVGLSAVLGARSLNAGAILGLDPDPVRRSLATSFGATHTYDPRDHDSVAHVRDVTQGRGADCVLEAAGAPDAFRQSLELVRPGGRVIWLGKRPPAEMLPLRFGSMMSEKQIVRSSYGGAHPRVDFPQLITMYRAGLLPLEVMISERFRLKHINEALTAMRGGRLVRALIVP